ncbi:MAG: tetraacyldisaccharide 4'-kinase, partial [Hyphomicrobiaceae bacterium]
MTRTRLFATCLNVRIDEPRWWYAPERAMAARLLAPAAAIYGWEARRRLKAGGDRRVGVPVICIGNFTAGGTGKTPMSLLVAERLAALGLRAGFLSRGYKARLAGPHRVGESDAATDVGDEPLLLARHRATFIARDRGAGAAAMMAGASPPDAIVMDDGMLNGSLHKDLTIALVDGSRGVGNACVIPSGPLRAPLDFQLGLVDAIVINRPGAETSLSDGVFRVFRQRFKGPILSAWPAPSADTSWLAGRPLVAYCGIGSPNRFFHLLEDLGGQIVAKVAFPDHHVLTDRDVRGLLERGWSSDCQLVTTEKDWVRLAGDGSAGELKRQSRVLPIRLDMTATDLDEL